MGNTSTWDEGMCSLTPELEMGLVNTSQQGQLWETIGKCAGAPAECKGFLRANAQVGVKGQEFMRVSP